MSNNREWNEIDECIGYITKEVVGLEKSIIIFKKDDERKSEAIENIRQQIKELKDIQSFHNNTYNYSIAELEERVQTFNNNYTVYTYNMFYSYIDLLRGAIKELEDVDNWNRIMRCIEENDNFSSFKRKYQNSTELRSFHYSEFFDYTEDGIKEILSPSFFTSSQKKNAQMKLYSLYADFKNFYEKSYYKRTLEKEKDKYADALRKLDAWIVWSRDRTSQLNQQLSILYAEQSYSNKVDAVKKKCLSSIYTRYKPEIITELCRKCGLSFSKVSSDPYDIGEDAIDNSIPPYIELYIGHSIVFTNTQGFDATKEVLGEIVSTYNELFITNYNHDYLGVRTPVKAYINRQSYNFMFRLLSSNNAIHLIYNITNYLRKHCIYPIQYYCCGKNAEKILFLETKGAKCFSKPLPILQDVFDIMINREEKLHGVSFYDNNNRLFFEGDDLLQLIVLFVFDYDSDEINNGSGKDYVHEILRRGQRMGILVIRITEQDSLGKEYEDLFTGNVWKEQDNYLFINNNIPELFMTSGSCP